MPVNKTNNYYMGHVMQSLDSVVGFSIQVRVALFQLYSVIDNILWLSIITSALSLINVSNITIK